MNMDRIGVNYTLSNISTSTRQCKHHERTLRVCERPPIWIITRIRQTDYKNIVTNITASLSMKQSIMFRNNDVKSHED